MSRTAVGNLLQRQQNYVIHNEYRRDGTQNKHMEEVKQLNCAPCMHHHHLDAVSVADRDIRCFVR